MLDVQSPDDQDPDTQTFLVIGLAASAGGLDALRQILSALPADFPACILVVQHRTADHPNSLIDLLQRRTRLVVKYATDGEVLSPAKVYVARPDRHLLVMSGETLHLSDAPRVKFARPSADCLFTSMAGSLRERAVAVVLSGSNSDGSGGLEIIKQNGGVVIAQHPATAVRPEMPTSAVATGQVDQIIPVNRIAFALMVLVAERTIGGLNSKHES